jgi:3-oxoacyl-[acyl-carrier-protein] synthase-1
MKLAVSTIGNRRVNYINAHGTSTPAGDVTEVKAVRSVFGEDHPVISSTKSMTGHSLGGAGVHETIYSLLMMQGRFIAPSINVTELDPALRPEEIATEVRENVDLDSVLSNSFGFGGTNGSIVLSSMRD